MSLQILTAMLFSTLIFQAHCVPVKRSIFDIAPLDIRFSPNVQVGNPNARQSNRPLFTVPDIQAPFEFAGNILNNIKPRRYYDTSENSLNGRVQMKYKMNFDLNPDFNQANEESGKDHTFKVTTIKPPTTTLKFTTIKPATTLPAKYENIWDNIFNGNDIFTTPGTDGATDDSVTTDSTTEFETTTIDDLLNRMAIPSAVLASLAG